MTHADSGECPPLGMSRVPQLAGTANVPPEYKIPNYMTMRVYTVHGDGSQHTYGEICDRPGCQG